MNSTAMILATLCAATLALPASAEGTGRPARVAGAPTPLASAMALPAGGEDFRRALLDWSSLPTTVVDGDLLEMPVAKTRLSSRFGVRSDPVRGGLRAHLGIDIPDTIGAPVHAAAGGTVVFAGWSAGYGYLVKLDHGQGEETRYGHLSDMSVRTGDVVMQGAVIGLVGSTGRSTGPHLHFEIRRRGVALDPIAALGSLVGGSPEATPSTPAQLRWGGFGLATVGLPEPRLR